MAHVAQIRTEQEAAKVGWPCHWCEYGEILKETMGICADCRKMNSKSRPTKFKIAETPR